ncbi:N-acetyltransferase [Spiroplasma poulsonii]|uniref:N-acetyltransferase n=1 Tax=Spiroplasma poulsonii TaxID=2138 RepID=A0A3S0SKU1_9MOLU|nr:GNAT family N-acetyltransferase [Spiroplasma poulsonii]MBW3058684.1 GNAT family N-acetyltransferase [Spiroplasma poulsonii]RUP76128.1 N-acetyltransferase [Spiroplasma poulsonii]
MILFETARLIIRMWKQTDLAAFQALNADQTVMEYFPKVLSAAETNDFYINIQTNFKTNGYGLYVVELKETHEFLGFCGFNNVTFQADFTPCIEIGWRLKQSAWGQGFATEAAQGCLNYAKNNLNFQTVYSFTSIFNQRSENVMKKLGMSKTKEFNHPNLTKTNWLSKHVLYQLSW